MRSVRSCGWWRKKGEEYTEWQRRGNSSRKCRLRQEAMAGREGGGAQFVSAITADLPSLTSESNQHCGGNSSA